MFNEVANSNRQKKYDPEQKDDAGPGCRGREKKRPREDEEEKTVSLCPALPIGVESGGTAFRRSRSTLLALTYSY